MRISKKLSVRHQTYCVPLETPRISPTEEQALVVETCHSLSRRNRGKAVPGSCYKVIAGAGTGKTSLLTMVANQLLAKNHRILYLTFNKENQLQAETRFSALGKGLIHCKTMHAVARSLCVVPFSMVPQDESRLKDAVIREFRKKIESWLAANGQGSRGKDNASKKAFELKVQQVGFWIFKTLEAWYRSKDELDALKNDFYTYMAAKRHHLERIGFMAKDNFYCATAMQVWERIMTNDMPMVHDAYIKIAQLARDPQRLDYSVILLDESQDTTACQLDLFVHQPRALGKHVYVVGDAVQSIYSFRGARPRHVVNLASSADFHLTNSFRFGRHIAFVANTILWAKQNSPQIKTFQPYRLRGLNPVDGEVFGPGCTLSFPFTIIARTNSALIGRALQLLQAYPDVRIALSGGSQKFASTIKSVLELQNLSLGQRPSESSWLARYADIEEFKKEAKDLEQHQHLVLLDLISTFQEDLPEKMRLFQEKIIDSNVPSKDAQVVLTTAHQSKGLEWESVEVENDFAAIEVTRKKVDGVGLEHDPSVAEMTFDFGEYGDDLNLWVRCLF
ncbi:hypothetical protein HDU91_005475 [Kappamyces sp. JEL0680]|nr:hypothetical protein HDU91_005475 [Kappamyces sp. JEL0680]